MNSRDSRTGGNILLSIFNIKSFIPSNLNNTNMNSIKQFPLKLLLIQCILTYYFTNTKRFSIQAYIMNLAWLYGIYFTYITKNIKFILIPIILKVFFFVVNIVYGNIPKYITTDYLYSDFFENVIKYNKCSEFYTEGDYNGILPFNTLDKNNEIKIQDWGTKMYNNAYNDPTKNMLTSKHMIQSNINKFKWIIKNLKINSNSKVLELGFGKIDLMKYIHDNTGATVEGTNLSLEQIKKARREGFKCYHINHENLGDYINILDRYDVIITNGSLEYLVNFGEDDIKYKTFADNVHKLLLPNGKWYTTTIHISDDTINNNDKRLPLQFLKYYFKNNNTFINIYNLYYLALGNEGSYPIGKDGLAKYVKDKFNIILQQDRTIDYKLFSYNWMICQINKNRRDTLSQKIKTNINHFICFLVAPLYDASYICYTPSRNWRYQPWLWQFLRQPNGHRPVDHYWIIFQKK